jgi:DnaJ-class molecular chaperone
MNKDYYNILNLNKFSTNEEIKKSYKKLALKYHPDKNQDNEECKNIFQEITEAYSVLSDEDKRKKYDMFGVEDNDLCFSEDPFKMFNQIFKDHLNQFKNMHYENNFDIGDVINELSGVNIGNIFDIPKVHVQVHSINKGNNNIKDILEDFKNNAKNNEKNKLIEEIIDDIIIHVDVDIKEIYNKRKRKIQYEKKKFKKGKIVKKKINLDINLYDKEIILKGNGNETENKKGDVCIYLHCNDKLFTRINEYDIYYQKEIKFKDYYLNKDVSFELPNIEIIHLNNVNGNKLLKIKNKGLPYIKDDEYLNGDLYFMLCVVMPELDTVYDIVNDLMENDDDIDKNNENIKYNDFKYINYNEVFVD